MRLRVSQSALLSVVGIVAGSTLVFMAKISLTSIYWPGGDYKNYLQNAYLLLQQYPQLNTFCRVSDTDIVNNAANAWWQPSGGSLVMLASGSICFNSFYPWLFVVSIMYVTSIFVIWRLHRAPWWLVLAAVMATAPSVLFFFEFPYFVPNLLLLSLASWLIRVLFVQQRQFASAWPPAVALGLVLALMNVNRKNGILLFAALLLSLAAWQAIARLRSGNRLPQVRALTRPLAVMVASFLVLNLAISQLFQYRLPEAQVSAALGEAPSAEALSACYYQYIQSELSEEESLSATLSFADYANAFAPELQSSCQDSWVQRISSLSGALLMGEAIPRSGHQLALTLQHAPTRFRYRNAFGSYPLSRRVLPELLSDVSRDTSDLDLPLVRLAAVRLPDDPSYQSILPVLRDMPLAVEEEFNKYLENMGIDGEGARRIVENAEGNGQFLFLAGHLTPLSDQYFTVVDGALYINLANFAGPIVADALYAELATEVVLRHPLFLAMYADNALMFFSALALSPLRLVAGQARASYARSLSFIQSSASNRYTDTTGLPEGMQNELKSTEFYLQRTDVSPPYQNKLIALALAYDAASILSGVLFWLAIGIIVWRLFRHRAIGFGPLVWSLFLVLQTFFLGSLAPSVDDTRYTDELRFSLLFLLVALIAPASSPGWVKTKPRASRSELIAD